MKQVIAIHGATTFDTYDEYLMYLASKPMRIDRVTYKAMWKELLQDKLGSDYQVLIPTMPNKTNARYSEWKIWFENLSSLIEDDCILIGHSMGAIFLAKYLSENTVPYKVKATILVAAPYDDERTESLGDFKIESLSKRFSEQAGKLIFFNGKDDPAVSIDDMKKYQAVLPNAEFNIVPAPDHFVRVEFPEIVELIRTL